MGVYPSAIVGLPYVVGRAEAAALLPVGLEVSLRRDRDNEHDEEAVAVYFRSVMLGFIPDRHAEWVAEILDRGDPVRAFVRDVYLSPNRKQALSVDLELFTKEDAANPVSQWDP